jgi:hypothetical protein
MGAFRFYLVASTLAGQAWRDDARREAARLLSIVADGLTVSGI